MPTRVSNMCINTLRAACEREKCGSTVSVAALMATTHLPPGAGCADARAGSAAEARPAPPSLINSRRDVSRLIVFSPASLGNRLNAIANQNAPLHFDQWDSAYLNANMDKPEVI